MTVIDVSHVAPRAVNTSASVTEASSTAGKRKKRPSYVPMPEVTPETKQPYADPQRSSIENTVSMGSGIG
jgi:hypothetical protein